jgi:hypothetical protein
VLVACRKGATAALVKSHDDFRPERDQFGREFENAIGIAPRIRPRRPRKYCTVPGLTPKHRATANEME